jgi:glycine/D-amino acid oxidase-like deaminating enzyme
MPAPSVLTLDFKANPLWWDDCPLTEAASEVPSSADVVIVGAGYCGVSAARVLAASGASVAVLDAEDPGYGASTRNHGHVAGAGKLPADLERRYGPERARMIKEDATRAANHLRALLRDDIRDVDYVQNGRFIGAHSRAAFDELVRRGESYRRDLGLTVDIVPEDAQRTEIGSDFYFGGITLAEGGALHPAKLHRGMLGLAESAGARICGKANVLAIDRRGRGYEIRSSRGTTSVRS